MFTAEKANILPLVKNIRRILDLDTDIALIEQQLSQLPGMAGKLVSGLRLPGIWCSFEAGLRAILGQQISVEAARKLVCQVVDNYGELLLNCEKELGCGAALGERRLFPTAEALSEVDFEILRIPQSRKNTLMTFCRYCFENPLQDDLDQWLKLKGIGPWTVNYAKMRGQSDSDIWLGSDLGVIKALKKLSGESGDENADFDSEQAKPWRSYLTFQCWNLLY